MLDQRLGGTFCVKVNEKFISIVYIVTTQLDTRHFSVREVVLFRPGVAAVKTIRTQ